MKTIGIVGAGQLGAVLATRLVALGYRVDVANSRGPQSLRDFEQRTGARAVSNDQIGSTADLLILAIPFGAVSKLPQSLIASIQPGTVVIDAGNYVPLRDGRIAEIDAGLPETAWVTRQLGVPVIKAFNSISDVSLEHGGQRLRARDKIALPVAGDDPKARAAVMELVEELGFTAWDAGSLMDSWRQQIGQPAYCTDGNRAQLPRLLARAKRESVEPKRDEAMRLMEKLPTTFPKAKLVQAARFMQGMDRLKPASWLAMASLLWAMLRPRQGQGR